MAERRALSQQRIDYLLGVHSGIPRCCVEFYSRRNTHGRRAVAALNRRRRSFEDGVQYVMCPPCLRDFRRGWLRAASVHRCTNAADHPFCRYYLTAADEPIAAMRQLLRDLVTLIRSGGSVSPLPASTPAGGES